MRESGRGTIRSFPPLPIRTVISCRSKSMFLGRFLMIIPVLAIAGSLARKKITPPSAGTLAVHTPLFASLLVGVILLVGALNFFPALTLGPVLEHFMLQAGRMF